MKLSAPLYQLKSQAKALKKSKGISLNEALDLVAHREGFSSWSLLAAKKNTLFPKSKFDLLDFLNPGDLMVIGARPGQGKTSFTLEMLVQAIKQKRRSFFFSLEYRLKDVAARLADIDESIGYANEFLHFDFSDDISSEYIIKKTAQEKEEGFIIAIDYLQLLDQSRAKPDLQIQVEELKAYAREVGCIIIFISQVDRSFKEEADAIPELKDMRLPNPLDVGLFNKGLFLHRGKALLNKTIEISLD